MAETRLSQILAIEKVKFNQYTTPKLDLEVLEVERRIRARVAGRMEPGRGRRFFDFGWLRRAA